MRYRSGRLELDPDAPCLACGHCGGTLAFVQIDDARRMALSRCLKRLRAGDTLIVRKLGSLRDLITTPDDR
jgi:hypothetical protein